MVGACASATFTETQRHNPAIATPAAMGGHKLEISCRNMAIFTVPQIANSCEPGIRTIGGNKHVTVPLNNRQATFDWTFHYSGPRTVSAVYSGDTNDQASVSPTLSQTITPSPSLHASGSSPESLRAP